MESTIKRIKGRIEAGTGIDAEEIKAWKEAGEPEQWPPKDKVVMKIADKEIESTSTADLKESPQLDPFEEKEETRDDRRKLTVGRQKTKAPSQFRITKPHNLYFKVYIMDVDGTANMVRGEMDDITKQCNVGKISVPRSILPQTLMAMYGKNLINIIYESAL